MSHNEKSHPYLMSSVLGLVRGCGVQALTYPLDVVKTRLQASSNHDGIYKVAKRILQEEGWPAFYKGFSPQLLKIGTKQLWCWPMITGIPHTLNPYNLHPLIKELITAVAISFTDAAITTPLEKARIQLAVHGKHTLTIRTLFKEGWKGFMPYSANLSVKWSSFLVTQRYFRDKQRTKTGRQHLYLDELVWIGIKTSGVVSFVAAPFDFANTRKHSHNMNKKELLSGKTIPKMYRGWPLSALSLVMQNIASVTLIHKLEEWSRN